MGPFLLGRQLGCDCLAVVVHCGAAGPRFPTRGAWAAGGSPGAGVCGGVAGKTELLWSGCGLCGWPPWCPHKPCSPVTPELWAPGGSGEAPSSGAFCVASWGLSFPLRLWGW